MHYRLPGSPGVVHNTMVVFFLGASYPFIPLVLVMDIETVRCTCILSSYFAANISNRLLFKVHSAQVSMLGTSMNMNM